MMHLKSVVKSQETNLKKTFDHVLKLSVTDGSGSRMLERNWKQNPTWLYHYINL